MQRVARELEVGDQIWIADQWMTIMWLDIEHRKVRLHFREGAQARLSTWTKVRCR